MPSHGAGAVRLGKHLNPNDLHTCLQQHPAALLAVYELQPVTGLGLAEVGHKPTDSFVVHVASQTGQYMVCMATAGKATHECPRPP